MPKEETIKRFFEPRKEFIEETRVLFLVRLETNKKQNFSGIFIFPPVLKYALVVVFVVVFLSGGLIIYADSNNVKTNNPLYGFKKTGEKVRMMIAPKEKRPIVCHQIAQRRAEEMKELNNNNMMKSLNEEYREKINLSLDQMAIIDNERLEQMKELCAEIAKTMAMKIQAVKTADIDNNVSDNFKEHCGQLIMMPIPVK